MTAPLRDVASQWTRIGCVGFGGPPAHIALFRELCVERRQWIGPEDFEDALATTNLLPGPGSTQMAIFCAWRVAGVRGALIGGLGFVLPGLVLILALSALFLGGSPPDWIRGAGAGAGAAVVAVAIQAGWGLARPGWTRAGAASVRGARARWALYLAAGAVAAAVAGPWLVLVLLACGAVELGRRRGLPALSVGAWPLAGASAAVAGGGVWASLTWTAFKVGALSYGGGFVIIPLMQSDAVGHGWMTDAQFLNAVALGQVTPGPVVHTVAAVGYAAAGVGGGLLAALVAFAPSFSFILLGADRFDRLRANPHVRAFLDGAGPAAIGAILGAAVPLARDLHQGWQWAVLAAALAALLVARRGIVPTLLAAGVVGAALGVAGAGLPPV